LRYFLVENWLVTTMGLVMGVAMAVGLNMMLMSIVDGAKLGPTLIVVSVLIVWLVGVGSALAPALRGARTSPAVATRNV
jgi:putative ABC transport system permease protein